MSRLPIRLRLTLAFGLAMALVLVAVGAFLYLRLASSLDEAIDGSLEARTRDVAAGLPYPDIVVGSRDQERGWQVLDPDGGVLHTTPLALEPWFRPLLEPDELARAARGEQIRIERRDAGLSDGPARILATAPIETTEDGHVVVVVAQALEDRDETLSAFLTELFLLGVAAFVLASLLGYALATAALRPVDTMRAEAAAVSAREPGRRLPLPVARDEIRRLGETLNAMLGRLEGALARERGFVADASHELRTPLALLQTELELALRRPRSPGELEDAVRSAAAEVDRLTRLAEDLLVLARVDEGRLPLRRESIPAAQLLDAVARRFAARAEAEGRAVEVVAPEGESLAGDRLRLEQALGNLVDNALRHGAGTVRLEAGRRDGLVELRVGDGGAGFPPDFLPRAFGRFARADEARGGGASGLGLAIVEAIARAHGGTAHALNRPGGGAVVTVTLPAAASADA